MGRFPQGLGRLSYDDYWESRGFEFEKYLRERELMMLSLIPAGSRVLDIGCGTSRLPLALKEKGCEVSVGDISPIVLDGFRQHGIGAVALDLDRVKEMPIEGHYNYIILSEVLEHMRNPEEVLQVLAASTDRFAITIPNSAFYRFRFELFFGGKFFKQWVIHPSEHLRFWSHTDFLEWLEALGFTVEFARASNGSSFKKLLPFLKDWWPNLFGHQMVYICRTAA